MHQTSKAMPLFTTMKTYVISESICCLIASIYAHSAHSNDYPIANLGLVCRSWKGAVESVLDADYVRPLVKIFADLMRWEGVYPKKSALSFKTWDWLLAKLTWYGLSTKQNEIRRSVDFLVYMTQKKKTNKAMKYKSLFDVVKILFYMDTGYVKSTTDENNYNVIVYHYCRRLELIIYNLLRAKTVLELNSLLKVSLRAVEKSIEVIKRYYSSNDESTLKLVYMNRYAEYIGNIL